MRKVLLPLLVLATASPAIANEVPRFIENDYGKAVAQAQARNVPLFVDAWAPW